MRNICFTNNIRPIPTVDNTATEQNKTKRHLSATTRTPDTLIHFALDARNFGETFAYFVHNNIARRHRNRVSYVLILSFPFSLSLSLHFTFVPNLLLPLSLPPKHIHAVSCFLTNFSHPFRKFLILSHLSITRLKVVSEEQYSRCTIIDKYI